MTTIEIVNCSTCGTACIPNGLTTGYGLDADGNKHCYACCAERDRKSMSETGRATLYLQHLANESFKVTNWPGSLTFLPFRARIGRHNIARKRYDVWFNDSEGHTWHGVTYGDDTQICHCRRSKA